MRAEPLPVTLHPRPSLLLAIALVLAHGVTAAGLAPTELSLPLKVALWFGLALSLLFMLRRHVWRIPVRVLTLQADGCLDVERNDGTRVIAQIQPQTTVLPWLCVLRLRLESRSLALTLPPDALIAEDHRQLRLWLRWKTARGA